MHPPLAWICLLSLQSFPICCVRVCVCVRVSWVTFVCATFIVGEIRIALCNYLHNAAVTLSLHVGWWFSNIMTKFQDVLMLIGKHHNYIITVFYYFYINTKYFYIIQHYHSLCSIYVCDCVLSQLVQKLRKWVGQKGDRSAANGSGIRMVENCGFCLVSSLVILVNHTPLGRVYTCLIFPLRC